MNYFNLLKATVEEGAYPDDAPKELELFIRHDMLFITGNESCPSPLLLFCIVAEQEDIALEVMEMTYGHLQECEFCREIAGHIALLLRSGKEIVLQIKEGSENSELSFHFFFARYNKIYV